MPTKTRPLFTILDKIHIRIGHQNIEKKPIDSAANPVIPPPLDKSIPAAPDASFPNSPAASPAAPIAPPVAIPLPPPISFGQQPKPLRI